MHKHKGIKFKNAFSLIELMVVIAIIGILSAIAVPSYRTYVTKANIAAGIPILEFALNAAIQANESTGLYPATLNIYGGSIDRYPTSNGIMSLNNPPVIGLHYNTGATSVWMCVFYSNLNIPGFAAWDTSSPNGCTYCRLCMLAIPVNGIYAKYCGFFNSVDIGFSNPQYVPSNCTTNLNAYSGS